MRKTGTLLLVVMVLVFAGHAEKTTPVPAPIVMLDVPWAPPAVLDRLHKLDITADCLPFDELFTEKKLFLYDTLILLPGSALGKEQFDDVRTFVAKGGLVVAFGDAGTIMDADGDRRITLPPDIVVSGKSRGPFYALTGGQRIGGSHLLRAFTVTGEGPIVAGFEKDQRIEVAGNGLAGMCAMYPAEGTKIICGNARVMTGRGDAERTQAGNVIQVRKTGQGASIWVSALLYTSADPWADRRLTNLFSGDTRDWCRRLP